MADISFFTPVVYQYPTTSEGILQSVDSLFAWGKKQAVVIKGQEVDHRELAVLENRNPTLLGVVAKVALYCTILLPLIALAVKCVLRASHQFYVWNCDEATSRVFLKAVRGEPIKDPTELARLKLSHLAPGEIAQLFNSSSYWSGFQTAEEKISKFAHLNTEEVQKTLYKDTLPHGVYNLITLAQLKNLDLSRLTSAQINDLFNAHSNRGDAKFTEMLNALSKKSILSALYQDKLHEKYYRLLPNELFRTLELEKLTPRQISDLLPNPKIENPRPAVDLSQLYAPTSPQQAANEVERVRKEAQQRLTVDRLHILPVSSILDAYQKFHLNRDLFERISLTRFSNAFKNGVLNQKQTEFALEKGKLPHNLQVV